MQIQLKKSSMLRVKNIKINTNTVKLLYFF